MRFDELAEVLAAAMTEVEAEVKASEERYYQGPPSEEIIAVCKRELPYDLHNELDKLLLLPADEVLGEVASLIAGSGIEEDPPSFFARMGWVI